jgi:hypothetical protein
MGPAPKCHFVLGLPSWSSEISEIGTLATLEAHNFFFKPLIEMSSKESCNLRQDLSNGMCHATCTQGNQGDSQLLVVGSQIVKLTPIPFFGHNLCFKNPNGSCEPILDI